MHLLSRNVASRVSKLLTVESPFWVHLSLDVRARGAGPVELRGQTLPPLLCLLLRRVDLDLVDRGGLRSSSARSSADSSELNRLPLSSLSSPLVALPLSLPRLALRLSTKSFPLIMACLPSSEMVGSEPEDFLGVLVFSFVLRVWLSRVLSSRCDGSLLDWPDLWSSWVTFTLAFSFLSFLGCKLWWDSTSSLISSGYEDGSSHKAKQSHLKSVISLFWRKFSF